MIASNASLTAAKATLTASERPGLADKVEDGEGDDEQDDRLVGDVSHQSSSVVRWTGRPLTSVLTSSRALGRRCHAEVGHSAPSGLSDPGPLWPCEKIHQRRSLMAGSVEIGGSRLTEPHARPAAWARWDWTIVIGLGTVRILDGLKVTIVAWMSDALKPESTGLGMMRAEIGQAGAIYVAGAASAPWSSAADDLFGEEAGPDHTRPHPGRTAPTAFSMTWRGTSPAARSPAPASWGDAAINSAIDDSSRRSTAAESTSLSTGPSGWALPRGRC